MKTIEMDRYVVVEKPRFELMTGCLIVNPSLSQSLVVNKQHSRAQTSKNSVVMILECL